MAKKRGPKIDGRFVPMEHRLIDSEVFISLSKTAKIAFMYFRRDKKNGHQTEVILTFSQAQKYGICDSPTTFNKVKRELVQKGLLDQVEPGGLNQASIFDLSSRWKWHGTPRFESVEYKPGVGSKYFRDIWKDENRRKNLIKARHGKTPNTVSV